VTEFVLLRNTICCNLRNASVSLAFRLPSQKSSSLRVGLKSEWVRGMDKKNGLRGMESALWMLQGKPGRGGKLAAASRR